MQNRQQQPGQPGDLQQDPEQLQRDPLQKVKEGFDRLRGCIDAEHCEYMDCIYFENPEQLREVVCFLETAINRAEREQLQRVP